MKVAEKVEKNPENLTPQEKSMLIPTLTEEEVKIVLGEKRVQFSLCYTAEQSTDLYHFEHGRS